MTAKTTTARTTRKAATSTTPATTDTKESTVTVTADQIDLTAPTAAADLAHTGNLTGYLALDRSHRNQARSYADGNMKAAMLAGDLPAAQAWLATHEAMKTATAPRTSTPVVVDWTGLAADRAMAHLAAAVAIMSGDVQPDGTPADVDLAAAFTGDGDLFTAIGAHLDTVIQDRAVILGGGQAMSYVGQAATMASAPLKRRGRSNDIAAAVRSVFAGMPVGTELKVSDVRKAWVAAGGPSDSDGRISARVFAASGCTIPGIKAGHNGTVNVVVNTVVIPADEAFTE